MYFFRGDNNIEASKVLMVQCFLVFFTGMIILKDMQLLQVTSRFLEVMLCKEESGLPEDTFIRRLWTKNYMTPKTPLDSDNSAGSDENREICSICMVCDNVL